MVYNANQRRKQSNTIKGKGNPNWRGGRIQKICSRCSEPFLVYPNRKNSQTHCSLTCANRDMADAQKGIVNPKKIHYGAENGRWEDHNFYGKRGEQSPNWKGGRTTLRQAIRTCNKYIEWRKAVFGRDNFTCQTCGVRDSSLEAHHKKDIATLLNQHKIIVLADALVCKELWDITNGESLCGDCHCKTDNYGNKNRSKHTNILAIATA